MERKDVGNMGFDTVYFALMGYFTDGVRIQTIGPFLRR
jgi:hypothetical protein